MINTFLLSEIYIYKISLKFQIIVDDHKPKAFISFVKHIDHSNIKIASCYRSIELQNRIIALKIENEMYGICHRI